jgi:hypothetical protein
MHIYLLCFFLRIVKNNIFHFETFLHSEVEVERRVHHHGWMSGSCRRGWVSSKVPRMAVAVRAGEFQSCLFRLPISYVVVFIHILTVRGGKSVSQ